MSGEGLPTARESSTCITTAMTMWRQSTRRKKPLKWAAQDRDLNMDKLFVGTDVWVVKDIFDLVEDALVSSYFVRTVDTEDPS